MTVITDVKNARYNADNSVTADVRFDDGVNADGTPLYFPYTAAAHDPA
ncbi:hypothetical protein VQZ53_004995, partial [Salmonella enterica]|nr:hypothetical protein [Salmonella enterica]EMD3454887.1 hypothetical protein [Salmonella enterica]EMD4058585.1 hypothetical protein [Salmonella enterica]EMD4312289.1 hypothetical protein [Salmonella enterica]